MYLMKNLISVCCLFLQVIENIVPFNRHKQQYFVKRRRCYSLLDPS